LRLTDAMMPPTCWGGVSGVRRRGDRGSADLWGSFEPTGSIAPSDIEHFTALAYTFGTPSLPKALISS